MKAKVRPLRPADMQSFVELCESRDTLDHSAAERRAEIVEWFAFHNPCDDGNPTYFVGAKDDCVLAHLGRMPCDFLVDGRVETASYFHDLYVHPELRKEGAAGFFLSMNLYRQCEAASKSFSAMIWTNQINISLQKARKYKQMWADHRVLSLGMTGRLRRSLPAAALPPAAALARLALGTGSWANGLRFRRRASIQRIERFDTRFDSLVERIAPTVGISPRKDHKYLNWKYIDRPHLDAAAFQLLAASGELIGFSVLVHPDSNATASVAELLVVDRDRSDAHSLLHHAIGYLAKHGAERIEAAASDPVYSQVLHQRLFRRDLRIPLFLTGSERSPNAKRLQSPSNWHLSLGDSEGPF